MIHRIVLVLGHVLFVIALTVCSNPLERDVKENDTDADSFSPSNSNGELDLENTSRIVGGNQADVGEYPYYVQSRGCGGVLIANEYVLTAAHCADITDSTMRVGAYKLNTLDNGAQQRTCRQYFDHPGFEFEGTCIGCPGFNAPFKLDFALCKLDKPVYVDDSKVELQLNRDNNFPAVDSKVTAVGLGTTSSGGFQATFLQEVDVEVDSNGDCAKASNPSIISDRAARTIYNSDSISEENICASVPSGGKDSCQGDSGGPLVQRQTINGKRVDTHVGITSFGIGCAFEGLPGVYSRTSYGVEFINKIICIDGQSRSPFCQTQVTCNNISEKKLVIRVVTDFYPDEVSWTLTNAASGSTLRNRERNFYDQQFFTYEESICLKKSESFKFQIKDAYGDGLTFSSEGFFSLTVDGEQIAKKGNYEFEEIVEIRGDGALPTPFPTPPPTRPPTPAPVTPPVAVIIKDSCKDDPNYIYTRPRDGKQFTCEKFLQVKRNRLRKKRCRKRDTARSSRRIKEFCPSYCLKKCRS